MEDHPDRRRVEHPRAFRIDTRRAPVAQYVRPVLVHHCDIGVLLHLKIGSTLVGEDVWYAVHQCLEVISWYRRKDRSFARKQHRYDGGTVGGYLFKGDQPHLLDVGRGGPILKGNHTGESGRLVEGTQLLITANTERCHRKKQGTNEEPGEGHISLPYESVGTGNQPGEKKNSSTNGRLPRRERPSI